MNTGKIIPIAFPDTYVRYSDEKVLHYLFPLVGLGRKKQIKAGHTLLLLIENATGIIQYFDFGRYVTPKGLGRVRSATTDAELHIPIKAEIDANGEIKNIEDILIWMESHPEKTHGQGRLVASVCHEIDYTKAFTFLNNLQNQGSVPYKTFGNIGSNCSRLVADSLIHSMNNEKAVKALIRNSKFTPSPLGNIKYGANGGTIYNVFNKEVSVYNKSILKENLTNYFDPNIPKNSTAALTKLPPKKENAQLLYGVGSSAYFEIESNSNSKSLFTIKRYNESFIQDFEDIFRIDKPGFDINIDYQFVYDSNCNYCHIKQKNVIYRFDVVIESK